MGKDLWMACWVMTSLVASLTSVTYSEAFVVTQRETEASLSLLLAALAEEEALRECLLVVVADEAFRESGALTELLRMPNQRQTMFLRPDEDRVEIQWKTPLCRAYFILVSDPSPVFELAGQPEAHWDHEGRYVILGLTLDDLTSLIETTNGRKTEHILGIIETEHPGQYRVYMNQLYWGPGMAFVTTWRRSRFTRRAALFPDKTSDLRGAELRVVQFELPPHIIYERDAGDRLARRFGRDVEVVRALAKVFRFRPAFVEPPPGQLWGDRLPNGSWDGIVDVLYTGKADIGVGNMYVSDLHDRMDFQHYSAPYAVELFSTTFFSAHSLIYPMNAFLLLFYISLFIS